MTSWFSGRFSQRGAVEPSSGRTRRPPPGAVVRLGLAPVACSPAGHPDTETEGPRFPVMRKSLLVCLAAGALVGAPGADLGSAQTAAYAASCERQSRSVIVSLDESRYPYTTDHIEYAIRAGGGGAAAHRPPGRRSEPRRVPARDPDPTGLRPRRVSAGGLERGRLRRRRALRALRRQPRRRGLDGQPARRLVREPALPHPDRPVRPAPRALSKQLR